ncbi:hypothetical protein [Egbenema bharatensis]|uniref:hypothetical protein n=1 Tax=Egbenema bharatensis TaxID=3463334 RepID=UPI003A8A44A3
MVGDHQLRAVGVFLHRRELESALSELNHSGFPMDKVSVIAKPTDAEIDLQGAEATDRIHGQSIEKSSDIVTDAVNNATWGTVLAGLTSLSLFGIGPILAAGSFGAALVTGVAGAGVESLAIKDLVQAMTKLGIPEKDARFYVDRVVQGNYLISLEGQKDEIEPAGTKLEQQSIRSWNVYDMLHV